MAHRGANGIVIGLPVNMDGTEGARCQSARAFGRNLLRLRDDLSIAYWDERLSSAAVNRMLITEADVTRARRAELVDKAAAAYILQGALGSAEELTLNGPTLTSPEPTIDFFTAPVTWETLTSPDPAIEALKVSAVP